MPPFNHELERNKSLPAGGNFADYPLPLLSFLSGVTALGGATDPTAIATNDQHVIRWGAADTDAILRQFTLPGEWAKDDGRLRVVVDAALLIGGSANSDVDLLCTLRAKNLGDTLDAAIDPDSVTVAGTAMATPANGARLPEGTDAGDDAVIVYEFDLSDYDPGSTITIKIVPDQAPGASNSIDLLSVLVRPRVHDGLRDRSSR